MSQELLETLANSDIENMDVYDVLSQIMNLPPVEQDVWETRFTRNIPIRDGVTAWLTPRERLRRRAEQLINNKG